MPSPKSLTKSVIKNWSWLCWRNAFAHLVNFCKREKKQAIRLPLPTTTKEAGEAQLQSMETETDLIRFWNNSIVKIAQQISNFNTNIIIWVRYGKSSIKELSQPPSSPMVIESQEPYVINHQTRKLIPTGNRAIFSWQQDNFHIEMVPQLLSYFTQLKILVSVARQGFLKVAANNLNPE